MSKEYSLRFLAEKIGCSWKGDEKTVVSSVGDLKTAQKHQLSFLSNKRYESHLAETGAGIVIVHENQSFPEHLNVILTTNPYLSYAQLSGLFCRRTKPNAGIHPSAVIDSTAQVDPSASVGPHCVVEMGAIVGARSELAAGVTIGECVTVGEDCLLYPGVVLYHDVHLGDRVTIHSNTVIGSDGFGYAPSDSGWQKIYQLGGVRVGSDVEVGASCAIDRGAIGDTLIKDGVIIDNQVHIAHNVEIGKNTALAGCVGIAGSTKIGANCTAGGMVGISGHLEIADNVHFLGGSNVRKSIAEPGQYSSGTLLLEAKSWRKTALRLSQIEEWVTKLKKLDKELSNLDGSEKSE